MKTKKIVNLIRKGKLAIKKDCKKSLRRSLRHCFPKDGDPGISYDYYRMVYDVLGATNDKPQVPTINASELWKAIKKSRRKKKVVIELNVHLICDRDCLRDPMTECEIRTELPKPEHYLPEGWKMEEVVDYGEIDGHRRTRGVFENKGIWLGNNLEYAIIKDDRGQTVLIAREQSKHLG